MNNKQILAQLEAINRDFNVAIAELKSDTVIICATDKHIGDMGYTNKGGMTIAPVPKLTILSNLLNGHAKINDLIQSLSGNSPETKAKMGTINKIIKQLQDAEKPLNVESIMTASLFVGNGNFVQADIPLIERAIMEVLAQG